LPTIRHTRAFTKLRTDLLDALVAADETLNTLQQVELVLDAQNSRGSETPSAPYSTPESSFALNSFDCPGSFPLSSSLTSIHSSPEEQPTPPVSPCQPAVSPAALLLPAPSDSASSLRSRARSESQPPFPSRPPPPSPAMATPVFMPTTSAADAPKFRTDKSGFESFFADTAEFARRANLSTADTIAWARRYAGSESDCWEAIPCQQAGAVAPTLTEFQEEVRALYPHLADDRRYTLQHLSTLIAENQALASMTRDDLGTYSRTFAMYTTWLIKQGLYSTQQSSEGFLTGLPPAIRARTQDRLLIVKPAVLPAQGYAVPDIQEAAAWVLDSGILSRAPAPTTPFLPVSTVPVDSQDGFGRLINVMTDLTRAMVTSAAPASRGQQSGPPGGGDLNTPRWGPSNRDGRPPPPSRDWASGCMFCSSSDHFLRECPVVEQYLRDNKIRRNYENKIVLPNGRFIPRDTPGRNMKERVDNFTNSVQHPPAATHFLESADEAVFEVDVTAINESDYPVDETSSEIQLLEARLESLREAQVLAAQEAQREVFDGVQVPPRRGPQPKSNPKPSSSHPSIPNVHAQPPLHKASAEHQQTSSGKPGDRAGDDAPRRPRGPMRAIEMTPKPAPDEPKYRYQAGVESSVKISDIGERILDGVVQMTTREAFAISPETRKYCKDAITTKKVSVNAIEEDPVDTFLTSFAPEIPSVYFDVAKYAGSSPNAAITLPLRVIYPSFGNGVQPECILDGGAQIVVMRKDIWARLRTGIRANKAMAMESANSGTVLTLGLVENHPVTIGAVKVCLQIQVVEDAPFEVLLGRPFFDITNCAEISRTGGEHVIHIVDPESGIPYTFPTEPRIVRRTKAEAAVNFR
jgi:hypothetical protein